MPDPIPDDNNTLHYKPFEEVYKTKTNEMYRPSSQKSKKKDKGGNGMPWSPSAQYAKNVGLTVQCDECNRQRALYSQFKLSDEEKGRLAGFLDTILFTCGTSFQSICDLSDASSRISTNERNLSSSSEPLSKESEENDVINTPNNQEFQVEEDPIKQLFDHVFINKSLTCTSPMETPYFSACLYPLVCFHCGSQEYIKPVPNGEYPSVRNVIQTQIERSIHGESINR